MTNIVRRKYLLSRRILASLWGRDKDAVNKRNYRPGIHGKASFKKSSEFNKQLTAKQKFKSYYAIPGRQFYLIYKNAYKKKGNTSDNFIGLLEARLSSILYHSSLLPTIFSARQLISHKHVTVNGRTINISSYIVKVGSIIKIKKQYANLPVILQAIKEQRRIPDYLKVDIENRTITFIRIPKFSDVLYPTVMEPNLVIEFYSR